jgi:hypothetical protein
MLRLLPQPKSALGALVGLALSLGCATARAQTSKPFMGVKVNQGTVTCSHEGGQFRLTLSDDFKVPETPAPHWQVLDSNGNAYLLNRLMIKGDKLNKSIVVPDFVPDVAKVQVWCAFAETVLGETTLACQHPVEAGAKKNMHKTGMFAGAKANKGFVTHHVENGKSLLTLSDDFVVPETPAPHWQVVDSQGHTYLLNRLMIKGDKLNMTIEIPAYVHDVAKVQIWCAFAETLLGEASFAKPVM